MKLELSRKNKPGAGRPPLTGHRMKNVRLTVPEADILYLREVGKDNISAAFREYINWQRVWERFRDATELEALNIGASIINHTYAEYPSNQAFRDEEQGQRLLAVGQAIIAVRDYFMKNPSADFCDAAIAPQMDIISYYQVLVSGEERDSPLAQFKAAVSVVSQFLPWS